MFKNRFEVIHEERVGDTSGEFLCFQATLKDKTTGALYLYVQNMSGAPALTPLIGEDGKPVIDKNER